jgi:hypothetical protein
LSFAGQQGVISQKTEPFNFVAISAGVNCGILKVLPWKTLQVGILGLKMFHP